MHVLRMAVCLPMRRRMSLSLLVSGYGSNTNVCSSDGFILSNRQVATPLPPPSHTPPHQLAALPFVGLPVSLGVI
jgi:hypothetical protein